MAASVTVTDLAQRTDTNIAVVHGLCIGAAIDTFALDDVYFSTISDAGPWTSTPVDTADSDYLWLGTGSAVGVAYRLPLTLPQNADGQIWIKVESTHVGQLDMMSGYVDLHPVSYNAAVQGNWAFFKVLATAEEGYFLNTTTADADEVNWKAYIDAGTYTCIGIFATAAGGGIVDVEVNGAVVATFDTYSVGNVYTVRFVQAGIVLTDGLKTISLVLNGKNPASADFSAYTVGLAFFRTA